MLMWEITDVKKLDTYEIVEIKCPFCKFKETLTRYPYENLMRTCYRCENTFFLPERKET